MLRDICASCPYLSDKEENPTCTRRGMQIGDPYASLCVNHILHSPYCTRPFPLIGPVYQLEGYPQKLEVLEGSYPDHDTYHEELASMLGDLPEKPRRDYPGTLGFDIELICEVGRVKAAEAIAPLKRILGFNPRSQEKSTHGLPLRRDYIRVVGLATWALASIDPTEALTFVLSNLFRGYDEFMKRQPKYGTKHDDLMPIRYNSALALEFYPDVVALPLLAAVAKDPHPAMAEMGTQLLENR